MKYISPKIAVSAALILEEACTELDRALDSKSHASSPSGLEEDQAQALALMTKCGSKPEKNAPERGESFARAAKETAKNGVAK